MSEFLFYYAEKNHEFFFVHDIYKGFKDSLY